MYRQIQIERETGFIESSGNGGVQGWNNISALEDLPSESILQVGLSQLAPVDLKYTAPLWICTYTESEPHFRRAGIDLHCSRAWLGAGLQVKK